MKVASLFRRPHETAPLASRSDFAVMPLRVLAAPQGARMLHHRVRLVFVAWLLSGTAATAQVGPEISYATSAGGRAEIHLINSDGTSHSLLYRGGSRSEIFHVDIRPGGGQLAIEEHIRGNPRQPANSAIKIIDYDANGSIVGSVRTLQLNCLTGSLDYHPTDGTLLYRSCAIPARIQRLDTTTMTSSDLGLAHNAFIAGWLDATHILYYAHLEDKLWTVSTGALASPTEVLSLSFPGALDTATSGDKGLWSDGAQIHLIDIAAKQISPFQTPGQRGHFSPDDQDVVYITGNSVGKNGQFVIIRRTDGSGAPTNLVGRGSFTAVDWRN